MRIRTPLRCTTALVAVLGGLSLTFGLAQAAAGAAAPRLSVAPLLIQFSGSTTLGTFSDAQFTLTNNGATSDTIDLANPNDVSFSGSGADDYVISQVGGCPGNGSNVITLAAGAGCAMDVFFFPGRLGDRGATATITGSAGSPAQISFDGQGSIGYYQVDEFGDVQEYGDANNFGDTGNDNLNEPIVGMAATGDNGGYWLVSSDGGIFSFGPSAHFYGSTGAISLNKPIVGMAATPDAGGYWLVASDGGIFSYGDAQFFGSTGAIHLNKPIVGMATTPDGLGYWLVASDGGIFSYGDAQFYGSTGALNLAQPISAMAAMPDGSGYWFSANDGGLFNYGGAPFYGSGADNPNLDIVVDMVTNGSPTLQQLLGVPALRTHYEQVHAPANLRSALAAGNR